MSRDTDAQQQHPPSMGGDKLQQIAVIMGRCLSSGPMYKVPIGLTNLFYGDVNDSTDQTHANCCGTTIQCLI